MSEITKDTLNGYVAFLDLLGFSELVKRRDFLDSFSEYTEIIENAFKTPNNTLQYIIFSDSLVVNTVNDDKQTLITLLKALSEVNYHLLVDLDLPVCGCISTGSFSRAETSGNVMIAGTPIVEAVHYEQFQDWIGIMLAPSIIAKYPALRDLTRLHGNGELVDRLPWPLLVQRYNEIPFSDKDYDGFVIIPRAKNAVSIIEMTACFDSYMAKLDALKLCAPDTSAQNKYERTFDFINWIHSMWRGLSIMHIQRDIDVITHQSTST